MTGDAREKLDHVSSSSNKPHQPQPKKRLVPSTPIWDNRFPTAKTVQEMMETMERMMEDPFAMSTIEWPSSPLPSEGVGGYRRRGRAPWEIKEGEGEYKLRFDMPGMNKEDVKVWVEEKMVVVKAEKASKKKKNEEEDEEWSSKSYGRYSSRIALPENVKFENIKAEVKDGVLYITIPKYSDIKRRFAIRLHFLSSNYCRAAKQRSACDRISRSLEDQGNSELRMLIVLSIKFTNHALAGVPIDDASSYNIIYNDKLDQLGLQQPYINLFCGTNLLVFNDFITRPCKTIDQALPLGEGACE
ncbi:hypothetical protein KIW84_052823 [Lathyrus oleraceus]|uniref:SHSP domain-containing protein n=1 Tax=Pisum sativum TaxID=3888 RepID=A0A9D4WNN2_PEA|nr:hypothetical protein KIW84_052823 [Pisum sativum]